jgi:hypothetical protein
MRKTFSAAIAAILAACSSGGSGGDPVDLQTGLVGRWSGSVTDGNGETRAAYMRVDPGSSPDRYSIGIAVESPTSAMLSLPGAAGNPFWVGFGGVGYVEPSTPEGQILRLASSEDSSFCRWDIVGQAGDELAHISGPLQSQFSKTGVTPAWLQPPTTVEFRQQIGDVLLIVRGEGWQHQ